MNSNIYQKFKKKLSNVTENKRKIRKFLDQKDGNNKERFY